MDLGQNIGKFKNSHKCTIFHLYGPIFLWSKAIIYVDIVCTLDMVYITEILRWKGLQALSVL